MSALPRGSRSRSRPATDTKEERHTSRASTIPVARYPKPSSTQSTPFLCPPTSSRSHSAPFDVINMVDTIAVQKPLDSLSAGLTSAVSPLREQSADHSSSLSELEDNPDEREELRNLASSQASEREDDSEAETEKLEQTPRKQRFEAPSTYTPSRLGHQINADDEEEEEEAEPDVVNDHDTPGVVGRVYDEQVHYDTSPSSPLSDDPEAIGARITDHAEYAGKKRKRENNVDGAANDAESDAPARKRSGGVDSDRARNAEEDGHIELRGPLEDSPPPLDSVENEGEGEEDQPLPVKAVRTKRQKGRGKKGRSRVNEVVEKANNNTADENTAEPDESAEVEAEDDDTESPGEQVLQKRVAFDKFAGLDAAFKALREDLLDEQISRLDQELLQINQNPSQHPEYLLMMTCIDARRDEAVAKEQYLLYYKEKDLRTRFVAERHSFQSQYVQTAREVREDAAGNCYRKLYALQRDRRRWGADDKTYGYLFNPKRSEQIKQQRAYNAEVSILSGIAKYAGFPAAPEIKGLREREVDEDLVKMGIRLQQTQLHPYGPHTHAENWRQTYPMNPSLSMDQRNPSNNPFTPAHQLRHPDLNAPNGSASTIDMTSNPPSGQALNPSTQHVEMARQDSTDERTGSFLNRFFADPRYRQQAEANSPVPQRTASEALAAFSYVSPQHRTTSAEPGASAGALREMEARRETSLPRMRAVGAAGVAGFSR